MGGCIPPVSPSCRAATAQGSFVPRRPGPAETARRLLPLALFPVLACGDLWAIYSELRSIHLRTLNKERAEIIVQHWLREGAVPTPRQVSPGGWWSGAVCLQGAAIAVPPLQAGWLGEYLPASRALIQPAWRDALPGPAGQP